MHDADFLARTFAGADLVYCIVPPDYSVSDSKTYYRNIGEQYAAAIRRTGVPRVIHLSSFGGELDAGTGVILGSHYVEEELKALDGVDLTIVRPTYFYYNLLNLMGSIRATGKILTNYGGGDKLYMVAPNDIADAVVEEVERPGFSGTILVAAGGEPVYFRTVGDSLTDGSRYAIASVTKLFTNIRILQLVDEGRIALDFPVVHYLPRYADRISAQLMPHHLLHVSGSPTEADSLYTTHHRGQIIADFRAAGLKPPKTDYIFYRRE